MSSFDIESVTFWSAKLDKKNPEAKWTGVSAEEGGEESRSVEFSHAMLGEPSSTEQASIVHVEYSDADGESRKVPFCVLRKGVSGVDSVALRLATTEPFTLRLVSGEGPVHVLGTERRMPLLPDDDDVDSEDEEMSDDEIPAKLQAGKRGAIVMNGNDAPQPQKRPKPNGTTPNNAKQQAKKPSGEAAAQGNTPASKEPKKGQQKPTAPANAGAVTKTPSSQKKQKNLSIDDMKAQLKANKALPKSEAKFANFCKNLFQVEDPATVKELWQTVEASRLKVEVKVEAK